MRVVLALVIVLAAGPAWAQTASLECAGYTPTLWVAPADVGNGSGSSAANAQDFPTALAAMTGTGNILCWVSGTYAATSARAPATPAIAITDSGGNGVPNIMVCRWPAVGLAEPVSGNANRCELQATGNVAGENNSPAMGAEGYSYVYFVGFYCNAATVAFANDGGCISMRGGAGKRAIFNVFNDACGVAACDDDNFTVIFLQDCTSCIIQHNKFIDGTTLTTLNHNKSAITIYNTSSFLIDNNTFDGVHLGIFIKGGDGGSDPDTSFNDGTISDNWFEDCTHNAINAANTNNAGIDITGNVILRCASGIELDLQGGAGGETHDLRIVHNTIVASNGGDIAAGGCLFNDSGDPVYDITWTDNICALLASSAVITMLDFSSRTIAQTKGTGTIDRNCYVELSGTPAWQQNSATVTTFAAWQALTGSPDANGAYGDPLFVSAATGNVRLSGGGSCDTIASGGVAAGAYVTGAEQIGAGGDSRGGPRLRRLRL